MNLKNSAKIGIESEKIIELPNGTTQIEYIWNGELLGDFPSWALKMAWKEQGTEVLNWLIDYMDSE